MFLTCWDFSSAVVVAQKTECNLILNNNRTLEPSQSERSPGNKVQKMQNLLKKGRANLSRSKSELSDQNRKMLQQLTRHRSELGQHNRRLLASFRIKENQSCHKSCTQLKTFFPTKLFWNWYIQFSTVASNKYNFVLLFRRLKLAE